MYAGLDVHKDFVQACFVNEEGKVVEQKRFETTDQGLKELTAKAIGSKCVIESSTACFRVYDALKESNVRVRVAHPARIKAIASAKVKTDKIDALTLAQLERADLIPEAHVPSKQTRELRLLVRQRMASVRESTRLKNRVHAILLKEGIHSNKKTFSQKSLDDTVKLVQGNTLFTLRQLLEQLQFVKKQTNDVNKLIEAHAKENPDALLLKTIPGVGWFSALAIATEIDDAKRFPNEEHLASYAGLAPTLRQSANTIHQGHVSKAGSPVLRHTLVQDAWVTIRYSKRLRKKFTRLARKKGPKKAIVATARKLLTIAYHMLKTRQPFDENRGERRAKRSLGLACYKHAS